MKGFFFISIFFVSNWPIYANVFTKNNIKISKSVLKEIHNSKKGKDSSLNTKDYKRFVLPKGKNDLRCFKLNKKLNGAVFSPSKIFPPIFIENSDTFSLSIDSNTSNIQIGIDTKNSGIFSFYTSLLDNKKNCFNIHIPSQSNHDLVVEVDDKITGVELDKSYKEKIRRDNNILFTGVPFGNVTLTINTKDKKKIDTIIHLHEGITQVISAKLEVLHRKKIKGYELRLMANKKQELSFENLLVNDFYSRKKLSIRNKLISLSEKLSLKGFNRIIEIKDRNNSFISFNKSSLFFTKMHNDYLDHFLSVNNFDSREDICLVHYGINNKTKAVNFIHSNGRQESEIDSFYLNKDGSISSDLKKNSHQIVIVGYVNGVIDFRFDNETTTRFGQSLCALGTYLIEN
jgi:hypothetical protein